MKCQLCDGFGRFDDIECMRCKGLGVVGGPIQLPLFVIASVTYTVKTPTELNERYGPGEMRIVDAPLRYPDPLTHG